MARKMASIATISKLSPIEGRDRVVLANFEENGYNVICSKDFQVGEKVVYFEVDSILPQLECFEFLRKNCFSKKCNGFKIRNMKMCGIYSNGIIFHTKDLPIKLPFWKNEWKSGYDLTDKLNVGKYEDFEDASPTPGSKKKEGKLHRAIRMFMMKHALLRPIGRKLFIQCSKKSGTFPTDAISKSDEDNIQNNKQWFDKYKDFACYATFKMEGKSVTLCNHKERGILIFGRNVEIYQKNELDYLTPLAERLKDIAASTGTLYTVQGELIGPGIQNNIYKLPSLQLMVYKVVDNTNNRTLGYTDLVNFCHEHGYSMVPTYFAHKSFGTIYKNIDEMQNTVEHLWFKVDGTAAENSVYDVAVDSVMGTVLPNSVEKTFLCKPEYHRHEGLVFRGHNNEFSFKVKSNEYQLEGL